MALSKSRKTSGMVVVYILLTVGAVMMLLPFYYMLITAVRRCHEAISELGPEASAKELNHAYSVIDRAAKKGVIHPNKAARLKSSLATRATQSGEASEA
jgi:ribosomal protein S20